MIIHLCLRRLILHRRIHANNKKYTEMKYLLICFFSATVAGAAAQPGGNMQHNKNTLLNQSFWQTKPDVEAVKAEITKGNDPAEQNAMAMDPVVTAINAGAPDESIIYLLEQKGNNVDKLTHDSRTYIFWAALKGNVAVMQYLIKKGAKVNIEDSHGMSPFNFAASAGQQNTKVYDLLLQNGQNVKTDLTEDGANALLLGVANDTDFKLTTYFQSKGLSIKSKDANGNTAFDYAARAGNIGIMKILLEKGVGYTDNAMLMAAQGGRRGGNSLEVFQYLESVGIKATVISRNRENVLHAIVRRPGSTAIIQYFLSKGVNINQADNKGNTVFMNASAHNQDTGTIALLLPLVKDINQKNNAGAGALALAVRNNIAGVAGYLINHGADAQAADAKGNTLVSYLFEGYNPRQAKDFESKLNLLKAKGFSITTNPADGNTLYHLAVSKNDLNLLKAASTYGADINAKNQEGLTALHKAAMMAKDDSIIKYLLSAGAQKDIKTSFNETAYDLASENEALSKSSKSIDFLK